MTWLGIGGPEHGSDLDYNVWRWCEAGGATANIATLGGDLWYEIDPVSASGTIYGYQRDLLDSGDPAYLLIPFQFWLANPGFDGQTAIMEITDGPATGYSRRLALTTADKFQLLDKNDSEIGITAALSTATKYYCLWLIDVRGTTRDMLWVSTTTTLGSAVIDVTGHGAADTALHRYLSLGSYDGKTVPTTGGPFYIRQIGIQDLATAPNNTPYGSVKVVAKMPDGLGTDQDFDVIGGDPAAADVDEIPADAVAYNEGDAAGEKSSYTLANADGADVPEAVQPIGARIKINNNGVMSARPYLVHSGTRDYAPARTALHVVYQGVAPDENGSIFNQINGGAWDATKFNALEVGEEIVSMTAGDKLRLDQIGVEYLVEGPAALPADFPVAAGAPPQVYHQRHHNQAL